VQRSSSYTAKSPSAFEWRVCAQSPQILATVKYKTRHVQLSLCITSFLHTYSTRLTCIT
jgi:hypothetical protein